MKKRVRTKYSEQFEFDAISNTLGMEKSALASQSEEGGGIITLITSIDWRYQMWKVGITMTDNVRKPFCSQTNIRQHHIFFLSNQNLTCDCLLIFVFYPRFYLNLPDLNLKLFCFDV